MNTDRTANSTECRAVEDLLVALAAGELESEHAAQLCAHLNDCAGCQAEFSRINRAGELAASLKLTSPEIDRYPEFLRRLAASEAQASCEAEVVALSSVERRLEASDEASIPAQTGMAAVIPLFGHRVAVRNGFGQGFDLRVTSSRGNQWLHLSAKSLTRVAAVVAGVSLAAGISVVAMMLLISWALRGEKVQTQLPEFQQQDADLKDGRPIPPRRDGDDGPWIQTASNGERTLAIWRQGPQLQFAWIEQGQTSLSSQLPVPMTGNRQPLPPRAAECSVASDGRNFVVLREVEGAVYAWHLKPLDSGAEVSNSAQTSAISAPPILISRKGAQPDITWVGDHYVAVWVAPDMLSPVIEMIELGRDGRPLQTSATVIAETGQGGKVGLPGIAGNGAEALVSYFLQGGGLMTRILKKTGDRYEILPPMEAGNAEGPFHMPIRLLTLPDGYLACWDVVNAEGAEIRLARLDRQGRPLGLKSLARARTPITSFDAKVSENGGMVLLWSQVQPGGALTFRQRFSLDGEPLGQAENLKTSESKPSAVAFGDVEGKTLIWPDVWQAGGRQIGLKKLD